MPELLRLGAPSMIFGTDLLSNVEVLSETVSHVEVVLFHTPDLHNIPSALEVQALRAFARSRGLTLSVHLPTSLEIASSDEARRRRSVAVAKQVCARIAPLEPEHYILHIPALPPTLVSVPGEYLKVGDPFDWAGWRERAVESLEELTEVVDARQVLVENINYSPLFLEPFLEWGLGLCLDVGHLVLGSEDVMAHLRRYLNVARELHIHGVAGHVEHLSLKRFPDSWVGEWVAYLRERSYGGPVTIEVFSPSEFEESVAILTDSHGVRLET